MTDHALATLLADHAMLLEGAEAIELADGTEWRLDGVTFAVVDRAGAEFRLRREVAAAALRTPDVAPSRRGEGWVRFAPPTLDGFAGDRARAWLDSAWRRVDEGHVEIG